MEEPGEAGIRFLPVKVNKAGAITGEALVSAERLGKLARHTGRILEEIGRELAAGTSPPTPSGGGRITMPASGASTPPPVTSRRGGRRPTALPACRQGRGILAGGCMKEQV